MRLDQGRVPGRVRDGGRLRIISLAARGCSWTGSASKSCSTAIAARGWACAALESRRSASSPSTLG